MPPADRRGGCLRGVCRRACWSARRLSSRERFVAVEEFDVEEDVAKDGVEKEFVCRRGVLSTGSFVVEELVVEDEVMEEYGMATPTSTRSWLAASTRERGNGV